MNSRKYKNCNVDVLRASYAKPFSSKKHLVSEKPNELIIPEWSFQEPFENKTQKIYNPKPVREVVRDNIKLDDKQPNEKLGEKMLNSKHFTNRALRTGFDNTVDSQHINHSNSKRTIKLNYVEKKRLKPDMSKTF